MNKMVQNSWSSPVSRPLPTQTPSKYWPREARLIGSLPFFIYRGGWWAGGVVLAHLPVILASFWRHLDSSWLILASSWRQFWLILAHLGVILAHLDVFWQILASPWRHLGSPCRHLDVQRALGGIICEPHVEPQNTSASNHRSDLF